MFIKTRKTAGTSVEIALSAHCSEGDVITRISLEDEEIRSSLGHPGPQNDLLPLRRYSGRDVFETVRKGRAQRLINHSAATRARRLLGSAWGSYFKFSIERNPFDRVISLYWWRTRNLDPRPELSDWIWTLSARHLSNWHLYADGDDLLVDEVLQYSDLRAGLDQVGRRLGLEMTLPSARAKGGHRSDRRSYREVIGSAERALIESTCAREIAAFGYAW